MTKRAVRMRNALSKMGWEVMDQHSSRSCKKCMAFVPSWVDDANYCPSCGTRLPKADVVSKTVDQLEAAIAYAIGETKKVEV